MKRNKAMVVVFVVLALALSAFATTRKIALRPMNATVMVSGPTTTVDLDAFCNQSPCNITWTVILSGSAVGSLSNTTGPTNVFTVGSMPGTAWVFATDDFGNTALATIICQN